jgi:WG containing repeat
MPTWTPTLYWGLIKQDGVWELQPDHALLGPFSSGLAVAGDGKKTGYVNRQGQFVIEPQFARADTFHDGYASVLGSDPPKWSIIDASGKSVLLPQFSPSSNFVNMGSGIFRVDELVETPARRNLKTTYIDKNGNVIWPKTK